MGILCLSLGSQKIVTNELTTSSPRSRGDSDRVSVPPITSFSAELPELFAEGQALHLIRRSDADAVDLFRRFQQSHVG